VGSNSIWDSDFFPSLRTSYNFIVSVVVVISLLIIYMQIILYVWLCPTPENESPTQCILQEILSYPSEDALIM